MKQNKESVDAIFVDLTNFYTRIVKSGLLSGDELRDYFLTWFDFSVLSSYLTGAAADTWVFHSDTKLGPTEARIDGNYLNGLITRFDRQSGVTTENVNIAGDQREPYSVRCPSCNAESDAIWKSEKGIDSSLIVHLFDTRDYWDRAFLLSGDADFVPAVRSLRRQGKVINGAGFVAHASPALIKECFVYHDLETFFRNDLSAYLLFKDEGQLQQISSFVRKDPIVDKLGEPVVSTFGIDMEASDWYASDAMTFTIRTPIVDLKEFFSAKPPLVDHNLETDFLSVSLNSKLFNRIHTAMNRLANDAERDFQSYSTHENANSYFSYVFQWNTDNKAYEPKKKVV